MLNAKELQELEIPKGYELGGQFELDGFTTAFHKATKEEKSGKEDDKFEYLSGVFSAETQDLEGEEVDQQEVAKGLNEFFVKLNRQVDWEHKYGQTQDPDFLIGDMPEHKLTSIKKSGQNYAAHWGLFRLFKQKEWAQKVLKHMDAGGKIGASLHGARIVPKAGHDLMPKVAIVRVSLTPNPINTDSHVDKHKEFMKSLTAAKVAPLGKEDLEGDAHANIGKIKDIALRIRKKYNYDAKQCKAVLSRYFGEQLKKGDLKMNALEQAIADADKELKKSIGEGESKPEEKSVLRIAVEGLSKAVESLTGHSFSVGAKGGDEAKGFEEAEKYLKSLGREELIGLAAAKELGDEAKGKKSEEIVAAIVKGLGKEGTVGLVNEYVKAVVEADEEIIKGLGDPEAETTTGEGGDTEFLSPGELPEYTDLCKAVEASLTGNEKRDQALAIILKSMAVVCEKMDEHEKFWSAFAKAVPVPGFSRTSQIVTGEGEKKGGESPATHTAIEVHQALRKAVEEGSITREEIVVAKHRAQFNVALPDSIEAKLFPAAKVS